MLSGIKYQGVSSFSSLALIIFSIWVFPHFTFSTHTITTPHYMTTSQILIQLYLWQSREKTKNHQLVGIWQTDWLSPNFKQRSFDFKDWLTFSGFQSRIWNMVLTLSLSVKDTYFYTEQIKGSQFDITEKIIKLLMHSHNATPEFHLFWFGRHWLIFKMWQSLSDYFLSPLM